LGCTGALVPRRGSVYPRPVARTAAGASARDVSGTVPPVNAARRAETEGMTAPPARNGWRRRREMTMRSLTRAGFLAGLALAVGHPAVAQETETQPANGAEAAPAEAPAETAEAADYDASTIVARVGETEITLGHVVALRSRLPQQYQALPDEALFQGLIDQLIDQELLSRTLSENPEDDPLAVRLHLENERRAALAQRAVLERVEVPVEDADIEEA